MKTNLKIIVCSSIEGLVAHLQKEVKLASLPCSVDFVERTPLELAKGGRYENEWKETNLVIGDPGLLVPIIADASSLQWLHSTWAGVEKLVEGSSKRDYKLTRLGGCLGPMMSEYVFGHILPIERRLFLAREDQRLGEWNKKEFFPSSNGPRKLSQLTMGLLGCGDIGKAIARTAKLGFGMKVIAYKRNKDVSVPCVDEIMDLHEVLQESDYIVNTLPSTSETRGMLNGLAEMLPTSINRTRRAPVFINVGRADIIDESVLLSALESSNSSNGNGRLFSSAVLDVFSQEPLPENSPLWKHPNVYLTPHIGSTSYADDVAVCFAKNLSKYLENEEMEFCVDWENAY